MLMLNYKFGIGLRKRRSMETEDTLPGNSAERKNLDSTEGRRLQSGVKDKQSPNFVHPSECLPCRILITAASLGSSFSGTGLPQNEIA